MIFFIIHLTEYTVNPFGTGVSIRLSILSCPTWQERLIVVEAQVRNLAKDSGSGDSAIRTFCDIRSSRSPYIRLPKPAAIIVNLPARW